MKHTQVDTFQKAWPAVAFAVLQSADLESAICVAKTLVLAPSLEGALADCPADPDFLAEEVLFIVREAPTKEEVQQFAMRLARKVLIVGEKLPIELIRLAETRGIFCDLSLETEGAKQQRRRQMIAQKIPQTIEPKALELLLQIPESHLPMELEKLSCLAPDLVREEDVKAVVLVEVKAQRFGFLDALEAQDTKKAFLLGRRLFQAEEAFSLVRMVRNRLQQLLVVQSLATAADVKSFLPQIQERAIFHLLRVAGRFKDPAKALLAVDTLEWKMRDGLEDPRTILALLVAGVCH